MLQSALDVLRLALLGLYTLVIGIPVLAVGPVDPHHRLVRPLARAWVRWILGTYRIRIVAEGLENVPTHAPVILMCNHQSLVDIAAVIHTLPPTVEWRFVAKKELLRVPIFGLCLLATRQIVIDRGDRARAVESLRRAGERIRAGISVIVFPEGTRSGSGNLRPFKSGPFHLAVEAQVPIVPVTVSGSQRITPKGRLQVHPGVAKIAYGKPVPTRGVSLAQRNALKARVREAIHQGYDFALQGPVVVEPVPDEDELHAASPSA